MNSHDERTDKISEIKLEFMSAKITGIPALLERYQSDEKKRCNNICRQYQSKLTDYKNELKRIDKMKSLNANIGLHIYMRYR